MYKSRRIFAVNARISDTYKYLESATTETPRKISVSRANEGGNTGIMRSDEDSRLTRLSLIVKGLAGFGPLDYHALTSLQRRAVYIRFRLFSVRALVWRRERSRIEAEGLILVDGTSGCEILG